MLKELKQFVSPVTTAISKESPTILASLAIVGVAATVVVTSKASVKANKELEKLEYESDEKPTTMEKVKVVAPIFIPTIAVSTGTIVCIAGSHYISLKRLAAVAAAYSATESKLKEFKKKAEEVIGTNKTTKIEDEIAKDKVHRMPPTESNIFMSGKGNTLCYDEWSGRYFKSDIETIRKAQNDLNASLLSDLWVSLNDLYYRIGLPGIKIGEELGWNRDFDGQIDITFSSQLTENKEPCLVLSYLAEPRYNYNSYE